jgi:hypothetical protein
LRLPRKKNQTLTQKQFLLLTSDRTPSNITAIWKRHQKEQ